MICALGCPFEGRVPIERLQDIAGRYVDLGITAISIADTIGVANPKLVYDTVSYLVGKYPDVTWNMHLHNTRDMALANTLAALEAGVSRFDGGVGGLGGCPYAPGEEFIPHALDSSLLRAGPGNVLLPAPERQRKVAS